MDSHHDDDGHGHGMASGTEGVAMYKLQAILITLVIALVGGLLPTRRQTSPTVLSLGNCFSGGIFISAAFLHMLQESVEGFATLPLKTHFPLAMFTCVLGILIPFFIEKVVLGGRHDHAALLANDKSKGESGLGIYVLWLMLGVHSIIEGAAVGIVKHYDDITPILIAIVAHKFFSGTTNARTSTWAENWLTSFLSRSFALGISLVKAGVAPNRTLQLVISFSCTTPGGILLGWLLSKVLVGALNSLTTEIVKGIAAGTFVYVALAEILLEEFSEHGHHGVKPPVMDDEDGKGTHKHDSSTIRYNKFLFVLLGVVLMSFFSMYTAH